MESTDEPEADFGCGEEDADEDEGEGDDPSSEVRLAIFQLNVVPLIKLTSQLECPVLLPRSTRCRL